mgnify:CR=1 FL=1
MQEENPSSDNSNLNNPNPDNPESDFPQNLRIAMARKGWTQAQLGEASNIGQGTISNYLNGKRHPSAGQFARLAYALGVSMEWLLTGKESDGSELWSDYFDKASDEDLERIMLSMPGPDIQMAVDVTRDTIRDLREQAKMFQDHAKNLLIDAERMEDHLSDFVTARNLWVRRAGVAASNYEKRLEAMNQSGDDAAAAERDALKHLAKAKSIGEELMESLKHESGPRSSDSPKGKIRKSAG